jgi:hypothetical protein
MKNKNRNFSFKYPNQKKRKLYNSDSDNDDFIYNFFISKKKNSCLCLGVPYLNLDDVVYHNFRENDIIISKENWDNSGAKIFFVVDVDFLRKYFMDCINKGLPVYFHEVFMVERPCYFFMDFDCSKKNFGSLSSRSLDLKVRDCMKRIMDFIEKKNNKLDWLVENSSNKNKISFHLKTRDLCFKNSKHLHQFVLGILIDIYTASIDGISKMIYQILDLAIYRDKGSLRMYYCSKRNDVSRILFHENKNNQICKNFDVEIFKKSILTNTNDYNKKKIIELENKYDIKYTSIYVKYNLCLESVRFISEKDNPTRKNYNKKGFSIINSFDIVKEVNEKMKKYFYMNSKYRNFDLKCYKAMKSIGNENTFLCYFRGCFCPLDKNDNKHKNQSGRYGIYIRKNNNNNNKIYIYCKFNPKCKDKKSLFIF